MPRTIEAERVCYFAPETLNQAEIAEALAAVTTPEEALEILNSRPTVGEYRIQEEALVPVPGPDGTTVLGPVFGERVVWVDEEPENKTDAPGHFEVYDAASHGEYNPIHRQGA